MSARHLLGSAALAAVISASGCTADVPEEIASPAVDTICCGATCCFIDGACRSTGERNPANMCQTCDPSRSQTAWTTVPGCTPTADASPPADASGPPLPDAAPRDAAPAGDGGSEPSFDASGPVPDAGAPTGDGGMRPAVDAGGDPAIDSGTGAPDGGSSGADSGGGAADAGGGGGGGGCAVSPGPGPAWWIALAGLIVALARGRRRR